MTKRLMRPNQLYGRAGALGVGKTKFLEDFVYDEKRGGEQYIPGTNVPRLKLVRIGPKIVAAIEDEVDMLIEALRAERDQQQPSR